MNDPKQYKAIAMWGKYMGSFPYYIEMEQERAAAANAPLDAIDERMEAGGVRTGNWDTVRDLAPDHVFRLAYEKEIGTP